MGERQKGRSHRSSGLISLVLSYFLHRWEELFFLVVYALLCFDNIAFVSGASFLSSLQGGMAAFASFELFVVDCLGYVSRPLIFVPLLCLFALRGRPRWVRGYLDALGIYFIVRMIIQLNGLNVLVFDFTTPRFVLITQLLFFLPYSLLIWGRICWRLDASGGARCRRLFRLDCDGEAPRPIDHLIASCSSVFSALIAGIKGR